MSENTENNVSIYFKSLTLENVKCFKGEHKVNFTDKNGNWARWTVILGNNNTGKTTILKSLKIKIAQLTDKNIRPIDDDFMMISSTLIGQTAIDISRHRPPLQTYFKIQSNLFINNFKFYKDSELSLVSELTEKQEIYANHHRLYFDATALEPNYYGISRKFSKTKTQKKTEEIDPFSDDFQIIDPEEWILDLDSVEKRLLRARKYLTQIKKLINGGILPDVSDFEIYSTFEKGKAKNYVFFHTKFGPVQLKEMGYGYQASFAWIMDLVKRMFERYPDAENPLQMPAIVLIDELDLHLHPEWQRKIISFLSTHFPQTQFIVTAHSPLLVQSAEEVNLVILHKNGDSVEISQPDIQNFSGWTVEEILTDIMGLENRVYSERYLQLIRQFDEALDADNYKDAKSAYDELDKILHPKSSQRKLMRIQMTSLVPDTTSENAI